MSEFQTLVPASVADTEEKTLTQPDYDGFPFNNKRPKKTFYLKTYETWFRHIWDGSRTFDQHDAEPSKGFMKHDRVIFKEWSVDLASYTGRCVIANICYIQRGNGKRGLKEGALIFGFNNQINLEIGQPSEELISLFENDADKPEFLNII